jgi:hypothetical protein
MPSIETFMTFLLALTLLEISPGPDMMLTIARGVGQEDVLHCLRFWAMSLSQVLCKFLFLFLGW